MLGTKKPYLDTISETSPLPSGFEPAAAPCITKWPESQYIQPESLLRHDALGSEQLAETDVELQPIQLAETEESAQKYVQDTSSHHGELRSYPEIDKSNIVVLRIHWRREANQLIAEFVRAHSEDKNLRNHERQLLNAFATILARREKSYDMLLQLINKAKRYIDKIQAPKSSWCCFYSLVTPISPIEDFCVILKNIPAISIGFEQVESLRAAVQPTPINLNLPKVTR